MGRHGVGVGAVGERVGGGGSVPRTELVLTLDEAAKSRIML